MIEITEIEARILASLIEKEKTVPDTYPLSLNGVKNSCNQKSNREPVLNLEDGKILHTLNSLADKEYIIIDKGSRTLKYAHRFHKILDVDRSKLAIIAVLFLRGPQTLNEIFIRSKRIFNFEDQEQTQKELLSLMDLEMAVMLPKTNGNRENRYTHQFCGKVDIENIHIKIKPKNELEAKFEKLECRVDYLQDKLDDALEALEGLTNIKNN
jgi:uncharacterized protein YceH (UPF0502 family)